MSRAAIISTDLQNCGTLTNSQGDVWMKSGVQLPARIAQEMLLQPWGCLCTGSSNFHCRAYSTAIVRLPLLPFLIHQPGTFIKLCDPDSDRRGRLSPDSSSLPDNSLMPVTRGRLSRPSGAHPDPSSKKFAIVPAV